MNNFGLRNLITNDSARIVQAISTGAGWEVWMQVELVLILRANGVQAAREVPYPPPSAFSLDVIAQDAAGTYAIELKVESANNAGALMINGINADRVKIAQYPAQNPGARWVVGLCYSNAAVQALVAFANFGANNAIFNYAGNIGVLVATV